ncbi:MAG TPA: helix-turn-helix transcriptional regulator [Solirubrobacterales bacterium]
MPRPSPQADRPQEALGLAIRHLRLQRELTQEELALRLQFHPTQISSLEGGRRNPTLGTMRRISNALEVSLSDLVGLAEELERRIE